MKRLNRKEEAVSPVIATILMVAITVVLAATLYMMVGDFGGDGDTQTAMGASTDQINDPDGWLVEITSGSVDWQDDIVILYNTTTGVAIEGDEAWDAGASYTGADLPGTISITFNDNDDNDEINTGDTFKLEITEGERGYFEDIELRIRGTTLGESLD